MDPNQVILQEWVIGKVLPMLTPGGTWMAPDPAPLSAEEIVEALQVIRDSGAYTAQTLITPDRDGRLVRLWYEPGLGPRIEIDRPSG